MRGQKRQRNAPRKPVNKWVRGRMQNMKFARDFFSSPPGHQNARSGRFVGFFFSLSPRRPLASSRITKLLGSVS